MLSILYFATNGVLPTHMAKEVGQNRRLPLRPSYIAPHDPSHWVQHSFQPYGTHAFVLFRWGMGEEEPQGRGEGGGLGGMEFKKTIENIPKTTIWK